ncbi:glycine zipper domain-containing protein [Pseudovibrio sp. Tun.PSC04-5.I4]|uniref:glycine zipper domain-containing protein n=1 Tax=Pseudovibrio sp. Tun.PSC04-5.I4 TaxID=1798213 RepID=UPI00087F532F|nr:glycine zipper domain-containing protein [Pseudovibrio sp. Tun.PSC04-5.I4]SDR36577.1 Glycine zipper [Pseudovibrio sp. Tun.PSC04-5.I4]
MKKAILVTATLLTLSACSEYNRTDRALVGGGLGAATGAAIGASTGDVGAAFAGAGIGALAGGLIGAYTTPRRCVGYDRQGRPYYYRC